MIKAAVCGMLLLLFQTACVPLPEDYLSQPQQISLTAPAAGLDSDSFTKETAHFRISAYSGIDIYAEECEALYSGIMRETGLYSFVPPEPYNITIYRDAEEYHRKTGMPEWSGGAAYGNALMLYSSPDFNAAAAHEMTHLIFNEFMGLNRNVRENLWINEGLAVYMETKASRKSESAYYSRFKKQILNNPLPFSQMVNLAPQNESQQGTERWYAQAWSVVSFMLSRGGSFNFSVFLGRLKEGDSQDNALAYAYTDWHSMDELEKAYLIYINR